MTESEIHNKEYFSKESLEYFFYDFTYINPMMILFYMALTIGLYFVTWLYKVNKKLEEIDEKAPIPRRAATVLVIFPFIWFWIVYLINFYFFPTDIVSKLISNMVKIIGWGLISFLSLVYVYDFCMSFGKVTNTSGLKWYLLIYPGYFSLIITLVLGVEYFIYSFYFLFFPILTIPLMQQTLNARSEIYSNRIRKNQFNYMTRY